MIQAVSVGSSHDPLLLRIILYRVHGIQSHIMNIFGTSTKGYETTTRVPPDARLELGELKGFESLRSQ